MADLGDDLLMVALQRGGTPVGVMACGTSFSAAVVEVQTTGKMGKQAGDPRPLTHTDSLVVAPFLNQLMVESAQTLPRTAFDSWIDDTVIGPGLTNVRAVGMVLRVIRTASLALT